MDTEPRAYKTWTWYSLEEKRGERGRDGGRDEGQKRRKEVKKMPSTSSELSASVSVMGLQCSLCLFSFGVERGISISRSWNQQHRTLNVQHLRSLGSMNTMTSHQSPHVPEPFHMCPSRERQQFARPCPATQCSLAPHGGTSVEGQSPQGSRILSWPNQAQALFNNLTTGFVH